ncbi:uncharacterized protein LOC143573407 [Bidens hawaiensis]|uniref:uncharacterized protein LOC143573407 n=1 Tax=Bidens hawaiensis TaxID=980011 RepID=UPI00404B5972
MQDVQFIGNGIGGMFCGGVGSDGGCLKCPHCGSLNTKFCYYNNYNLSQPRFFCKGCRRYWTKGGILRNVPVGGGSRKAKRSKQKSGNGKSSSVSTASAHERKSNNSKSSSSRNSIGPANILPETTPFNPTLANQSFEPPMLTDNHLLFSEMGAFRSLMTSSSNELPQGFVSAPETSLLTQQRDQDQAVAEDWGLFDQSCWLNNTDHQLNYLL